MTFSERAVAAGAKAIYESKLLAQPRDPWGDGVNTVPKIFCREAAQACLTAALAVDGLALQGWQTIESAPRDGTCVLLVANDDPFREVATGWWDNEWRDYGDMGRNGQIDYQPTHWQPLPAPPLTAASDGEVG